MNKNIEKKFEEAAKSALDTMCYHDCNGVPYAEIYADYRDEMEDSTLAEICETEDPRTTFYEKLYDWYEDAYCYVVNDIVDKVLEDEDVLEYVYNPDEDDEYDSEKMYTEDEARDIIRDMFYVDYPDKHFLDQNICVDVMVDTGDVNYDFTCNNFGPHYDARENEPIPKESSLLWLARQQGFTKSTLKRAMKERPKVKGFMQSVYDEINNTGSHMNTLTFLVEMTFGEWLNLRDAIKNEANINKSYTLDGRHGRGYIVIGKNGTCGLFDEWSGSGSILELKLDRDVKLPIRYIYKAVPDCCLSHSIKKVYGCGSNLWDCKIKEVRPMHRKRKK